MGARKLERREMAEARWPMLANLLACHFNQDFDILYGSLDGAFAALAGAGSLAHRRAMLKEWRDWNAALADCDDLRRLLHDGFGVDLWFRKPVDARQFMDRVYETLLASVVAETRAGR